MPSIVEYLSGFTNQGQMHDFAHASRLYLDDTYALAPKNSWIFYVVFSINPAAISEVQWINQNREYEAGMLVKSADLPKFKIATETINQYNRKTLVQQKITYEPISISFHDDMSNVTNSLWVNYFRYYYRDTWWGQSVRTGATLTSGQRPAAFQNNWKYSPEINIKDPLGRAGINGKFGLNNNQSVPFFNAITIYQLNAKRFTSYVLVNPLLESWEHDQLDQNQGSKFAQSRCTVGYETVFYGEGRVARDNPQGFATFHYDRTPSPLSLAGGGNSSIFGPGGIVQGAEDIFGATDKLLSGQSAGGGILGVTGIAIQGSNLIRNYQNITSASLRAEGKSILNSAIKGALTNQQGGISGLIGGGLGSLGKSLGFGPQVGTMLVGSNFQPTQTIATAGAIGSSAPPTMTQIDENFAKQQASAQTLVFNVDSLLSIDEADKEEVIAQQEALLTRAQKNLDYATANKDTIDAAVNAAYAQDGPAAAALIRQQAAQQGYVDPLQSEAEIEAYKENLKNIDIRFNPSLPQPQVP
jgi:hypothetical protein